MASFRSSVHLLAGLMFSLAACSPPPEEPPPPCVPDCAGRICGDDPVCGESCGECADDGVCIEEGQSCRPALEIGAPCEEDLECGANRLCVRPSDGAPGGYCSRECLQERCPDETICQFTPIGLALCHASCDPAGGYPICRLDEGYRCNHDGWCSACVPSCSSSWECGDDGCGGDCGRCSGASSACEQGSCVNPYRFGHPDLPAGRARWDIGAAEVHGLIWLVGGNTGVFDLNRPRPRERSALVDRYNPHAREFTSLPDLPVALAGPQVAALGTAVFIVGELPGPEDDPFGDGLELDPRGVMLRFEAGEWKATGRVPEPSMGSGLAAIGGRLHYFVGGLTESVVGDRVHIWDPESGWSRDYRPVSRMSFALAQESDRVWLAGGWDGERAVGTVETFHPDTGWSRWADLPYPVVGASAVVAEGRVFVFGGYSTLRGDELAIVQSIDLETRRTALVGTTFEGLLGQSAVRTRDGEAMLFGGARFDTTGSSAVGSVVTFKPPMK